MTTPAPNSNFGDCEDTWAKGSTWRNDLLYDGNSTGLKVEVINVQDQKVTVRISISEDECRAGLGMFRQNCK